MAITFSSGSSALIQRQLNQNSAAFLKTGERLSSGLRINRASDDAAGLAVSSALQVSARVFTQGIRNISDGISALSIAEGSLSELSGVTMRLQELASQAANGSFSLTQRRSLQKESDQLVAEFNRIISTTQLNRIGLLDTSTTNLRVQGGFGSNGGLSLALTAQLARATGTGSFQSSSFTTGNDPQLVDINGDGYLDIVNTDGVTATTVFGRGDGTFTTGGTSATTLLGFATGDVNGDGVDDLIAANSASGALLSNTTRVSTIQYFTLTSQVDARAAIEKMSAILTRVGAELGSIGASQSRLGSALNTLRGSVDGYVSASSRITDADIAADSAEAVRLKILQDAAAALSGQANQAPRLALSLLL